MNMKTLLLLTLSFILNSSLVHASSLRETSVQEAHSLGFTDDHIALAQELYDSKTGSGEKPTYTVALVCAGLRAGVVINGGLNGCIGVGRKGLYLLGIAFGSFADVSLTADGDLVIGYVDYDRGAEITGTYESFKVSLTEGIGGTYLSFEKPDHSATLRLIGVTLGLGGEFSYGTAKIGAI